MELELFSVGNWHSGFRFTAPKQAHAVQLSHLLKS